MTDNDLKDRKFKPTIPESQRQQLYRALINLVGVALGIALTLGAQAASFYLQTSATAPDVIEVDPLEALGTTHFTDLALSENLAVTGNATVGGTLGVTGNTTLAGTLTLDSITVGPVAFGTATTVVSGTTIAHGLATTPTVVVLTPASTGGYTTTVPYILATDTTSITVGVADAVSIATLHWLAGK